MSTATEKCNCLAKNGVALKQQVKAHLSKNVSAARHFMTPRQPAAAAMARIDFAESRD
jgi:hypothetical protein